MQETGAGLEHMPAPLHVLAGMTENPSAEHRAAGHATAVGVEQTPALHVLAGMRARLSAEQLAGAHGTAAGVEQTPAPPHVLAGMRERLSAEQLAAGHGTAAGRVHTPAPSQVPVPILDVPSIEHIRLPHVSPAWVWQAVPLAAQRALVPQAWSVAQAAAQQTFAAPAPALVLTQLPLAQSPAAVQEAPFAFGIMHSPPIQAKPAAQGAVAEQLVAQTPAVHR
ncbi:MAG TPA: hypothetical protein VIU64_18135 [Polyangia bacterium]